LGFFKLLEMSVLKIIYGGNHKIFCRKIHFHEIVLYGGFAISGTSMRSCSN